MIEAVPRTGRRVLRPRGLALLPWALFGNADDGVDGPPDWRPDLAGWRRRVAWWARNPAHNFTAYVAGVAHRDVWVVGRYPRDVMAPAGINWTWTFAGPIGLPFVSWRGRGWLVYAGWRPGGSLGFKVRRDSAG